MKIGILGSGEVARTIGSKLVERGHEVKLGTRDAQKLAEWQATNGANASVGSFAETAAFGDLLFNCTLGIASLEVLQAVDEANLNGKILVDVSNSLDFSQGFPPSLVVCNTDSLGEQIQRTFPQVKVVKALNTVTANLMVEASLVPGDHDLFVCGNDAEAKATVINLVKTEFGWQSVIDMGDISAARATEMFLPIWVRLYGLFQSPMFNFKIVR
jgi:hypothetical protein